jgi:SAM-dependent methyltransferase
MESNVTSTEKRVRKSTSEAPPGGGNGSGPHATVESENGDDAGLETYSDAVTNGFYQRDEGGLSGKYDNVRRYWEDQVTRYALHDLIEPVVTRKRRALSRIRVLDLGAGSGEGYEILTTLRKHGANLSSKEIDVLPSDMIGCYKGVDISKAMVDQGRQVYESVPKVEFDVADLSNGLGTLRDDVPYDLYFSSYGSLSHLRDAELKTLLEDVLEHMGDTAIFVADLVGRYSFEWQCYWEGGTDEDNMRQYSMSYLYPSEMLDKIEVERFPMRYWGTEEIDGFVSEIAISKDVNIVKREFRDRSILVGRHMATAEYNPHAQPIRDAVNNLHEFTVRTDLETLIFDYTPRREYPELNEFFEEFQMAWNAVVRAAIEALDNWDDQDWLQKSPPDEYPDAVQQAIRTIRDVVGHVKWFRMGDPLANVIEPQLGYILRNLEMDLQRGLGAAHGLLAIYQFDRSA